MDASVNAVSMITFDSRVFCVLYFYLILESIWLSLFATSDELACACLWVNQIETRHEYTLLQYQSFRNDKYKNAGRNRKFLSSMAILSSHEQKKCVSNTMIQLILVKCSRTDTETCEICIASNLEWFVWVKCTSPKVYLTTIANNQ